MRVNTTSACNMTCWNLAFLLSFWSNAITQWCCAFYYCDLSHRSDMFISGRRRAFSCLISQDYVVRLFIALNIRRSGFGWLARFSQPISGLDSVCRKLRQSMKQIMKEAYSFAAFDKRRGGKCKKWQSECLAMKCGFDSSRCMSQCCKAKRLNQTHTVQTFSRN